MARLIAAESALRNFIQLKDCAVLIKSSHIQDAASLDFTSDELLNENGAGGGVGGAANGNEWLNSLLSIHFLSAAHTTNQPTSQPTPIYLPPLHCPLLGQIPAAAPIERHLMHIWI